MFNGNGLFLTSLEMFVHSANILNKLIISILMAQYHNAPSDLGDLASGKIGIDYQNK